MDQSRFSPCLAALAATVVAMATPVAAADLFTITVTVPQGEGESTGSTAFGNIDDIVTIIENGDFAAINPDYTQESLMESISNIRGLDAIVAYRDEGPTLTFEIPSIGVSETFSEATRGESERALEDFLRDNEEGLLTQILQALAEQSPVDPVAGNPNSLQSKMVESDFAIASGIGNGTSFANVSRTGSGETGEAADEAGSAPNLIGLGARFGSFSAGGFQSNVVDLPIGYVIPLADPRWAVNISAPLTYVETEGTDTYAASVGVGLRVPVLDNWFVTPALRFGGTGSEELGAASLLYSGSITSSFQLDAFGLGFRLGNSVAYLQTIPVEFQDSDIDYDLQNVVTRNGLGVSGGIGSELYGEPLTWEASFVNTLYFGDSLFVENANEISFTIGTEASQNGLVWDSFRLGVSYIFTDADYDGFRLSFGAQF
ncbi:hypothetical protein [Rubrimonas cliftonensis]|uniref:Uncharacterized protein n=1 Tax=Rubrimonas cliftonensis TaxID=89524 RepID=A0A1H3YXR8_9RHOB|nr:hypothetical protein [Rubrimonas cliftonensis]SEA16363.1 hypothetical protein SAMN05444370_103297 [Rubrimonas cliftonensis]